METRRAFSRITIAAAAGTALSAGREDRTNFLKQPEVEPAPVCDVYDPHREKGIALRMELKQARAKPFKDFRHLLYIVRAELIVVPILPAPIRIQQRCHGPALFFRSSSVMSGLPRLGSVLFAAPSFVPLELENDAEKHEDRDDNSEMSGLAFPDVVSVFPDIATHVRTFTGPSKAAFEPRESHEAWPHVRLCVLRPSRVALRDS